MKLPQAAVFYRPATDPARRCDACIMWQDRACTRVAGQIDPGGTCDIFYPAGLADAAAEAYRAQEVTGPARREATCVFCDRIANGEYDIQFGAAVAFPDSHPVTPGHLLVVPIEHVKDALEKPAVTAATMRAASEIAAGLYDQCNLITSAGPAATQTTFHLHIHIVPRRPGDGLPVPWGEPKKQPAPAAEARIADGTSLVELAADAYLSGWALTQAPYTERVHAGLTAAIGCAAEHQHDPGVLEATLQLGHLEGTWALVYARRERLQRKHERAILAAWRTCLAGLDPGDLARRFRALVGQHGETAGTDRQWWQDTGIAAAAAWLARVYQADGYDALVATLADAIRAGMAEGEAGALALAASRLGRTGFQIDRAFKAAYKRLAGDQTISRQAAQAATRLIDATAGDVGRRLAKLAGDGASQDDMTDEVGDVLDDGQAADASTDWTLWAAIGAGAMALAQSAGVQTYDWLDVGDERECATCASNASGSPYAEGDIPSFPAHPRCRCDVQPSDPWSLSSLIDAFLP